MTFQKSQEEALPSRDDNLIRKERALSVQNRMRWILGLVAGFATLTLASCDLLRTDDAEGVPGRGGKDFDPYNIDSGAVRLGLQLVNGCATLATRGRSRSGGLHVDL